MSDLYPDPPHLTAAVFSDRQEVATFAGMCEVAADAGALPLDLVEVGPPDREFELLSDLGAEREILAVSPARRARLVAGQDPKARALRAGFAHRRHGTIVVEYIQRMGPGPHPIGLSAHAGALGLPDSLWSGSRRRAAYAMADWIRGVLRKIGRAH